MMAEIDRIKRNISSMIEQSAPESDIDEYVASEGVTAEQLRGGGSPQAAPEQGKKHGSFADSVAQGVSFGFNDELSGLIGGALYKMKGKGFGEGYDKARGLALRNLDSFRERNPNAAIAGEVLGALPTMAIPGMAPARAATFGGRLLQGAKTGAIYGGVYGTGAADEGLANRAMGGGFGAALGGVTGGIAEPIAAGVGALGQRVAGPIRGLLNPEREASKRVALARSLDEKIAQPGLGRQDLATAANNSQPVYNVDRGGEYTRALARSAANTSPEARVAIDAATSDRFEGQGSRIVEIVRNVVGGNKTVANRAILQDAARKANRPAYKHTYSRPEAQSLWDDALAELAGAPEVQTAMRQAGVTGRSRAALDGFEPIKNPFVTDPVTGRLSMREGMTPNLQFWDHVKRNLDSVGTREAKQAAKVLREHLDDLVPSYKTARAGAAEFFGAEDALSAGEAFVTSRVANDQARVVLSKMSKAERQLFSEGFADNLVRRVNESGDRRSVVINSLFNSPASRERIVIALGGKKFREIETALRIEDLLDKSRQSLGNSTTARQMVELGLAGGSGVYGYASGDWGAAGVILSGLVARRGLGAIDVKVAKRVGTMLASSDPSIVKKGIETLAGRDALLNALRTAMSAGATQQGVKALGN